MVERKKTKLNSEIISNSEDYKSASNKIQQQHQILHQCKNQRFLAQQKIQTTSTKGESGYVRLVKAK